jgi:hypothetical protein
MESNTETKPQNAPNEGDPEVEKKEEELEAEQEITPFNVTCGLAGVNYDKLIDQFGCSKVEPHLIEK